MNLMPKLVFQVRWYLSMSILSGSMDTLDNSVLVFKLSMQLLCSLICSLISDKSEMRWCSLYVCMYVDGGRTMALCSAFYLLLDISV